MPERTVNCDRCGQHAQQSFGEGGRGWYESFHCPSCGEAYESDGGPPTPDEFRQVILREEGEWVLEAPVVPPLMVLKALRKVLSLSLPEVQQLRNRLPGRVSRGTKYEMMRLLRTVEEEAGLSALVVRPIGGA
jgi:hypothetical protein